MNQDLEHLKWLSVGFYIQAGLTALFACIPFIHLGIGIAIVSGGFDRGPNPPPPQAGWIFVGAAAVFILIGWAFAIAVFLAGRSLKRQKNYTFVFVMAIISCMFAPLGTALGIFTIIVLLRESVKKLFNEPAGPEVGATPADWK